MLQAQNADRWMYSGKLRQIWEALDGNYRHRSAKASKNCPSTKVAGVQKIGGLLWSRQSDLTRQLLCPLLCPPTIFFGHIWEHLRQSSPKRFTYEKHVRELGRKWAYLLGARCKRSSLCTLIAAQLDAGKCWGEARAEVELFRQSESACADDLDSSFSLSTRIRA
jgi:hypothetical protein